MMLVHVDRAAMMILEMTCHMNTTAAVLMIISQYTAQKIPQMIIPTPTKKYHIRKNGAKMMIIGIAHSGRV
jgi:hypothetical protein